MVDKKSIEISIAESKRKLDELAEIAWNEKKTSEYIISQLGDEYVWYKNNALIYKLGKGTPIFFRAELDALQTIDGPKHICGHSAHLASLMGAYRYFKENPPQHTIYFIFQPSEEGYPSGATFISENFLKDKNIQAGFAFHVFGRGSKQNKLYDVQMASGDYFEISIAGVSTHVKNKNTNTHPDPLVIAADLIKSINQKKYKNIIMNIGKIEGGTSANCIAGKVMLYGDIRTNKEILREKAFTILQQIIKQHEKKYDSTIDLFHSFGYPVLNNDINLIKKIKKILTIDGSIKSFGTEDFSLYPFPYVFLYIGTGTEKSTHEIDFNVPNSTTLKIFHNWIKIDTTLKLN